MRLFKRKQTQKRDAAQVDPATPRLCGRDEIDAMLAWQLERAASGGPSFCVLYVVPQVLGEERIGPAEAEVVPNTILEELRDDDRTGEIADCAYLVVLAHTEHNEAQTVAHRLATEFTVRSAHVNRRNWRVGIAAFPDDGITAAALTEVARAHALGRRAA